jgi:hypothetical protein
LFNLDKNNSKEETTSKGAASPQISGEGTKEGPLLFSSNFLEIASKTINLSLITVIHYTGQR